MNVRYPDEPDEPALPDRIIAIVDVATAFLQSDKYKKDELPPPLVSDGDDESDDETFTLKEGLDNNMTSHDSSININMGSKAGQDRTSPSPRGTGSGKQRILNAHEQGSGTGRSSISEYISRTRSSRTEDDG